MTDQELFTVVGIRQDDPVRLPKGIASPPKVIHQGQQHSLQQHFQYLFGTKRNACHNKTS